MRPFFFLTAILFGTALLAQGPTFMDRQQSSGVVGLAPGQTARLNVLYPTVPAPLLQIQCSVSLAIFDDQRSLLKSITVPQLIAGYSASLDANADTDVPSHARTQIHGVSLAPNGCNLVMTLEIIDNATQKTVVVVDGRETYPAQLAAFGRGGLLP